MAADTLPEELFVRSQASRMTGAVTPLAENRRKVFARQGEGRQSDCDHGTPA